jgi:NADH-quinone oxidoreductase subunit N
MNGMPDLNLVAIAPMGFVAIGSMVVLVGEVWLSRRRSFLGRPVTDAWIGSVLAILSAAFLGLAIYAAGYGFALGGTAVFDPGHPMIQLDRLANLAIALLGFGALLSALLSVTYLVELRINHGEYYALLLFATCGMMLLVASVDFIALFLGLELMSIPIYVLAGFDRRKRESNESSLKYFLVGSFASAILLYGAALLYGATGHVDFPGIRAGFDAGNPLAAAGLGLVVVGFGFKVSSVPFHQWTPDVYEGAPTSVTAFMSVTVKLAAFVALLRFVAIGFGDLDLGLERVLWALAAVTMIVGNVMAIIQDNVKRMLAYSSIAHAGYLLIGFVAGTAVGRAAVMFYLIAYLFMTLGAFGVVVALANRAKDADRFDDWNGLARRRPGLAALMTLFMLSLAGIPGTAGFAGKFAIFAAAVQSGAVGLTIIAVLASVVSVYFYLRLPVVMYMREPGAETPRMDLHSGEWLVLAACALGVVLLGLFPVEGPDILGLRWIDALDWARDSVALLR